MKLTVIIPVYNEIGTIAEVIKRVKESHFHKEVIVVDDGSTDGTRDILAGLRNSIKVIFHEANKGKGAAIRTALPHVTGDIVIIQDADLEYNPSEYPRLITPILEGAADVVYGSRFIGEPNGVLFSWHSLGNKIVTKLSNMLSDLNLSDMETGYKVFRAEALKKMKIECDRFGFEPEVTSKIARMGYRIYEVPISYRGRNYSEGKKIKWEDGVAAIYWIIKYNLFR
jgi:glycosyltransferase involved in cell wall biosynthesis